MLPVVRFQDADFAHAYLWCRSDFEQPSWRWKPYGMPRLNPNFLSTVAFLYGRDTSRDGAKKLKGPFGTAAIVALPAKVRGIRYVAHYYAVTAAHVPTIAPILRINTKEGKVRHIEFESDEWLTIAGGDDLAAIDITTRIRATDQLSAILAQNMFVTKEFSAEVELGVGEDGFMLGMFADHPGKERNLVAARFGNVSLLASDDAPISQAPGRMRPSHIFDMRSRPGFSGSPVFVYRTPAGDLRSVAFGHMPRLSTAPQFQRQTMWLAR